MTSAVSPDPHRAFPAPAAQNTQIRMISVVIAVKPTAAPIGGPARLPAHPGSACACPDEPAQICAAAGPANARFREVCV